MQALEITLVTGSSGAGKTTWIQQQIRSFADTAIYLSLGSEETAIDATYLAAEVPGLTVLPVTHLANFSEQCPNRCILYLELGFHIDLTSLILPDKVVVHRRVAVLPPETRSLEYRDADFISSSNEEISEFYRTFATHTSLSLFQTSKPSCH